MTRYNPETTRLLACILDMLSIEKALALPIAELRIELQKLAGFIDVHSALGHFDEAGQHALEDLNHATARAGRASRDDTLVGLSAVGQELAERILAGGPDEERAITHLVQDAVVNHVATVLRAGPEVAA